METPYFTPYHRPTHPGTIFKNDYMVPLGLTVTETALHLGISRKALSEFINGRTTLSPDMAQRLAEVTGTSVESWMQMQYNRDIWDIKQRQSYGLAKLPGLASNQ